MRGAIIAAALCAAVVPAVAQAALAPTAPHWTILVQQCWKLSPTAGQCAVNVMGDFATRAECIAANHGQLEQKGEQDGRQVGYRCEILLK